MNLAKFGLALVKLPGVQFTFGQIKVLIVMQSFQKPQRADMRQVHGEFQRVETHDNELERRAMP